MSKVANLSFNNGVGKWQATYAGKVLAQSPSKDYVCIRIREGHCRRAKMMGIVDVQEVGGSVETSTLSPVVQAVDKFGINERFDFLTDFVLMVADGTCPSLLVTGEGGLGKTFTVNKAMRKAGREMLDLEALAAGTKIDDKKFYAVVKGYSTAKGLYRTLYENRNRIIIFDDCDTVLRDPVALNLLKGALDSYDKRIISWNAESSFGGDEELPRSFEFKGGVIFISNLQLYKIDQAVKSRALPIDLSMTTQQKIDRMETLIKAEEFLPEYSAKVKRQALDFLEKFQTQAKELSLRTLIQVVKVAGRGDNWERRAEYLLTAA